MTLSNFNDIIDHKSAECDIRCKVIPIINSNSSFVTKCHDKAWLGTLGTLDTCPYIDFTIVEMIREYPNPELSPIYNAPYIITVV